MWRVTEKHIESLTGAGGERFAEFMNALLRVQCLACGIPAAQVHTCLRQNIRDGGVDAQIDVGSEDDPTGWLRVPTLWQFKATGNLTGDDLRGEIRKHYAAELLRRGHAYRLCVCADVPSEKKAEWLTVLDDEARQIKPDASGCRVLAASDLAAQANRFPGLLWYFGGAISDVLLWDAWKHKERGITREYVPVHAWAPQYQRLKSHADLAKPVTDPVLTIQGVAGVGKTRLVFEAIAEVRCGSDLVLYTADDRAAYSLACELANDANARAILVADECPLRSRERFRDTLRGYADRIRVIAIDNEGERPRTGAPELRLNRMSREHLERILERNFPLVPTDRRRTYVEVAGGFVRLAADMARRDPEIASAGHLGPALGDIQTYYARRLSNDDRKVVEAIALVQKAGFASHVSGELDELCKLTGLERQGVMDAFHRIKDAPGFLVRAGRYLYVSPDIIAQIAFKGAWRRWAEDDPERFLAEIPAALVDPFMKRVGQSSSLEVRSRVGSYFRNEVASLVPVDLADPRRAGRLLALIETDPAAFFPQLKSLIAAATREELVAIDGSEDSERGTRRGIVWAAERLAAFPEHFHAAELILRRLAVAENEPGLSNNATGIWHRLFRILLSGTAVPFPARLRVLEERLFGADPDEVKLALGALGGMFSMHVWRSAGPAVVGGRIPPFDWKPATPQEADAAIDAGIGLLERMLGEGNPELVEAAWRTITSECRGFLQQGRVARLKSITDRHPVPVVVLPALLTQIEEFIQYECTADPEGRPASHPHREQVLEWREGLRPRDFRSRLIAAMGKDAWRHRIRDDMWQAPSEIAPLAEELFRSPDLLAQSLDYLTSAEARSAGPLGWELGRRDTEAVHLNAIEQATRTAQNSALLRGYLGGLISARPDKAEQVNDLIDRLEESDPALALDIITACAEHCDILSRLVRLVRLGKVPPAALERLMYGRILDGVSSGQFREVFELLTPGTATREMIRIAEELIDSRLRKEPRAAVSTLEAPETIEAVWRVLEEGATLDDGGDYWWGETLGRLAPEFPERSAAVAVTALLGEVFDKRERAASLLAALAVQHPDLVMGKLGDAILDPERGWHFQVGRYKHVMGALPAETVARWLDRVGVEGARAIASHLPPPFLDSDGKPALPPVTHLVLEHFGDDETTFGRFFAGVHDLQLYSGDIAATHRAEAQLARAFLSHPVKAVRAWAAGELRQAKRDAGEWQRRQEELDL